MSGKETAAIDTLRQMFAGLCFCHEQGVLHRDVKPQNVLIKGNMHSGSACLKLADFGLARTFRPDVRAYTREIQTLWYRAPEILLGAKEYGPAVDIWSAGAVIYELCETPEPTLPQMETIRGSGMLVSINAQLNPTTQTIVMLNEKVHSTTVSRVLTSILKFWPTDRPCASRAVQLCSSYQPRVTDGVERRVFKQK
ncbi:mitogen-activated protein kinase, putative [Perkinsus marinus ATCC 50983]|uniref:Cyclin-dependent kinase 2 homolog n=1 Tax=Perkinsus marinus (strain ATCC 50983 / TXsc) TaxID=423536 RepID=C5LTI3_PERM5|nr:mitogen-activated protein kinase, putative [Perkinsus marinus ATCC 50983]EEQ99974.1 mitogen-activated protein kinase, putative [Perkinsus marinus ATCC 50983]|eukprot:XP_002767257.1 mitogen-activated protein kinase, putative [Perkinsus marinus ATCC 50983]